VSEPADRERAIRLESCVDTSERSAGGCPCARNEALTRALPPVRRISLGTWQYNDTVAADAIAKGLKAGFTHIVRHLNSSSRYSEDATCRQPSSLAAVAQDTAENYQNQKGVGAALKGLPRDSYFLTTKTVPCSKMTEAECMASTTKDFLGDLTDLGLDYVDLILLHGPSAHGAKCDKLACAKDIGQWKAYEALYKAGKAKAIGVSNYCVSCYECLIGAPGVTVVPAVNQIEFHAGMGPDPAGA
jgi:diketogulonate reductase-like aldo/keto reductase